MLRALGPRLQHLSVTYSAEMPMPHEPIRGNSLSPGMLRHCPLLTHVSLIDLRPRQSANVCCISTCHAVKLFPSIAVVSRLWPAGPHAGFHAVFRLQKTVRAAVKRCTQMHLSCPGCAEVSLAATHMNAHATAKLTVSFLPEHILFPTLKLCVCSAVWRNVTSAVQDSLLPHVLGLRRLKLDVGLVDHEAYKGEEYSIAPIIRGVCACAFYSSTLEAPRTPS